MTVEIFDKSVTMTSILHEKLAKNITVTVIS